MTRRIAPAYFKVVEHELYNYDATVNEVDRLRDEHINTPPVPPHESINIQRTESSNPTHDKAYKIMSNSVIAHMDRTINAIDKALIQLDEMHNEIFELKYRQGKNWRQIIDIAHMGQDTFFRKRRELIYQVAVNMGFINIS